MPKTIISNGNIITVGIFERLMRENILSLPTFLNDITAEIAVIKVGNVPILSIMAVKNDKISVPVSTSPLRNPWESFCI